MTNEPRIKAWHFVRGTLRDGGRVPADGEVLTHKGPIKICQSGFHASRRLIDALKHAPGMTACRVECWGDVEEQSDKLVARNRVILWRVDAEGVLRRFARRQALSVVHLWDMPSIVRQYLETGDPELRVAAYAAADAAERVAAYAAYAAAAAADAAERAALRAAAAAADAARYAAADATRYVGRYGVGHGAADATACASAASAGNAVAGADAYAAADQMLTEMVMAQHKENQR